VLEERATIEARGAREREIALGERVGIAKRSHRDVLRRPAADAWKRGERRAIRGWIAAITERERPAIDLARQGAHRRRA
jgi:hypothetical protein